VGKLKQQNKKRRMLSSTEVETIVTFAMNGKSMDISDISNARYQSSIFLEPQELYKLIRNNMDSFKLIIQGKKTMSSLIREILLNGTNIQSSETPRNN